MPASHERQTSPAPAAQVPLWRRASKVRWDSPSIRSSAPPVLIVGSASRYDGGYRVNV